MLLDIIISTCFGLGFWLILKGVGINLGILFPIGLTILLVGLSMKDI